MTSMGAGVVAVGVGVEEAVGSAQGAVPQPLSTPVTTNPITAKGTILVNPCARMVFMSVFLLANVV